MSGWFAAGIFGLVCLGAALAWSWTAGLRKDTTRLGMQALAAMTWHQFSHLVRQSLQSQGMQPVHDELPESELQGARLVRRDDECWLLACKHGSSYRINAATVEELVQASRLHDAHGLILATEGSLTLDGWSAAHKHKVDVLTGQRLWQTLSNHLPGHVQGEVEHAARRQARRNSGLAVAASCCLAVAASLWLQSPEVATVPSAMAQAAVAAVATPSGQARQANIPATPATQLSEQDVQAQRISVSKALSASPGIIRGFWISKMTLVVDRKGEEAVVWPQVCNQLERYPALRTSRVQLNPPVGSNEPVRWRQCKTM